MVFLIDYIWQSSFCLLFFFGIYWCFLRGEKAFNYSRIFLLVTPVLALLFPLLKIPVDFSKPSISLQNLEFMQAIHASEQQEDVAATFGLPEVLVESTKLPVLLEWGDYLLLAYLFICTLLVIHLLWQLLQLRLLSEKGWYQTIYKLQGNYFLIPTFGMTPVFSFFDKIFWDDTQSLAPEEKEQILNHEKEHIRQKHSWDMLFYQVLTILFWFNPGIHLMRSALIDTHEFSADAKVLKNSMNKDLYPNLIVKIAFKGLDLPVGNHFIRSSTLKRIMMMKKSNRKNWVKLLMVIPLTGMLMALVSMKTTDQSALINSLSSINIKVIENQILQARDTIQVGTRVFKITNPKHYEYISGLENGKVSAQLGYLGYEFTDIDDHKEHKQVLEMIDVLKGNSHFAKNYSDPDLAISPDQQPQPISDQESMVNFISRNLSFPIIARELEADGTVLVEFIVDREGNIKSPILKESMGMGLDDEVLRLFNSKDIPKWKPALKDGSPISTLVELPVVFETRTFSASQLGTSSIPPSREPVITEVDEIPYPNGGAKRWHNYISSNMEYPMAAINNKVEGTVYLSCIIGSTGIAREVKVISGIGAGADEEAVRLLEQSLPWTPAKVNGKAVSTQIKVPIKFDLAKVSPPNPNRIKKITVMGYSAKEEPAKLLKPKAAPAIGQNDLSKVTYYVNGRKTDLRDVQKIVPTTIESITVLNKISAKAKYPNAYKDGVIEIALNDQ